MKLPLNLSADESIGRKSRYEFRIGNGYYTRHIYVEDVPGNVDVTGLLANDIPGIYEDFTVPAHGYVRDLTFYAGKAYANI